MKIETDNREAEFYLASLALGMLYGMQQGVIHPEAGIWSLGRPVFADAVLASPHLSLRLKEVVAQFDEIDFWDYQSENQQQMLAEMIDNTLSCLQDTIDKDTTYWARLSMAPLEAVDEQEHLEQIRHGFVKKSRRGKFKQAKPIS